jgi:phosphatidylglycerophosphate synthase
MSDTKPNDDISVFDGTRSKNDSFLSGLNQKFISLTAPLVPSWIQTYHLTACTYLWAFLCFLSGYLSRDNPSWLWIMALSVFGHYITDALDGEIGRRRHTGLVRWGFYVDHFGDFVFLICILIGLSYPTPPHLFRWLMVLMGVWSTFFVNAYFIWIIHKQYTLAFFRISSIEIQLILGAVIISFAQWGSPALAIFLHVLVPLSMIGLIIVFLRAQYKLWHQDLDSHSLQKKNL